jgi:hypothetical protein
MFEAIIALMRTCLSRAKTSASKYYYRFLELDFLNVRITSSFM